MEDKVITHKVSPKDKKLENEGEREVISNNRSSFKREQRKWWEGDNFQKIFQNFRIQISRLNEPSKCLINEKIRSRILRINGRS